MTPPDSLIAHMEVARVMGLGAAPLPPQVTYPACYFQSNIPMVVLSKIAASGASGMQQSSERERASVKSASVSERLLCPASVRERNYPPRAPFRCNFFKCHPEYVRAASTL